jgi:hypothetical protein
LNVSPEVVTAVFEAIDELNATLAPDRQLDKELACPLFGVDRRVESMDLVMLLVSVEDRLRDHLDVSVSLVSERAMSQRTSPFLTVGTLCTFADTLVNEARQDG